MANSTRDIVNSSMTPGVLNVSVLSTTTDSGTTFSSPSTSFQNTSEISHVEKGLAFAYNPILSVLILVVVGIISIETVLSNMMVLLAIYIERPLRRASNYLITSLAFCDMQIGILGFMFCTSVIFRSWLYGWVLCHITYMDDWVLYGMSQFLACLIAVDGYLNVTSYEYQQWRTDTKALVFLAITFTVNFAFWLLVYIFATSGKEIRGPICGLRIMPIITNTAQSTTFWVPLCVLIYLYCRFYRMGMDNNNTAMDQDHHQNEAIAIDTTYNCSEQELDEFQASSDNKVIVAQEAPILNETALAEQSHCFVRAPRFWGENGIFGAIKRHKSKFACRNQVSEHASLYLDVNSNSTDDWINIFAPTSEVDPPPSQPPVKNANISPEVLSPQVSLPRRKISETRMRKAKWTVSFILWTYIICYGPFASLMLIKLISIKTFLSVPFYLRIMSYQLTYFNSALNPFLYAYRSRLYRHTFKRILRFNWKKNNRPVLYNM